MDIGRREDPRKIRCSTHFLQRLEIAFSVQITSNLVDFGLKKQSGLDPSDSIFTQLLRCS